MENRLPGPFPAPNETVWDPGQTAGENLRSVYQWNQRIFRARVESGEDPEAVRESMLTVIDLWHAVIEGAIDGAAAGVSTPDQVVEQALDDYPAYPRTMEN